MLHDDIEKIITIVIAFWSIVVLVVGILIGKFLF
jgi:hypothetical protein